MNDIATEHRASINPACIEQQLAWRVTGGRFNGQTVSNVTAVFKEHHLPCLDHRHDAVSKGPMFVTSNAISEPILIFNTSG